MYAVNLIRCASFSVAIRTDDWPAVLVRVAHNKSPEMVNQQPSWNSSLLQLKVSKTKCAEAITALCVLFCLMSMQINFRQAI